MPLVGFVIYNAFSLVYDFQIIINYGSDFSRNEGTFLMLILVSFAIGEMHVSASLVDVYPDNLHRPFQILYMKKETRSISLNRLLAF